MRRALKILGLVLAALVVVVGGFLLYVQIDGIPRYPVEKVAFRLSRKTAAEDADRDDAEADTEAEETERHEQEPLKPINAKTFLAELAEWDGQKFKAGSEEAANWGMELTLEDLPEDEPPEDPGRRF